MSEIQVLLDKNGKIHETMKDIRRKLKEEKRNFTDEERVQWDKALADMEANKAEIKQLEADKKRMEDLERSELEFKTIYDSKPQSDKKKPEVTYRNSFLKWARRESLNSEEIKLMEKHAFDPMEIRGTNTNVTTTDGLGGYIVPDEWRQELIKTMEAHSGMLEAAKIVNSADGRKWNVPTVPYFGGGASATQKGHRISENTADTVQDINFDNKVLEAYVYSSYEIQFTWEMMRDSMFDIVSLINEIGGMRLGAIINEETTTGTGSSQPQGIVPATSAGKTAASAATLTGDEIVDLKHSVNRAYRRAPNVRFMFNDSLHAVITKLSYGTSDTAVWVPSFREGTPDTILGHPYTINDDMASISASAKTILFGDFDKFWIRKSGYPAVARTDERDIAYRRSVFYLFDRADSELMDANAIKHLAMGT